MKGCYFFKILNSLITNQSILIKYRKKQASKRLFTKKKFIYNKDIYKQKQHSCHSHITKKHDKKFNHSFFNLQRWHNLALCCVQKQLIFKMCCVNEVKLNIKESYVIQMLIDYLIILILNLISIFLIYFYCITKISPYFFISSKQFQQMRNQSNAHGHILKFVQHTQTSNPKGKKCYPRQTYGVSEQSPLQFKQKNSLISDRGYKYKYQNLKQFQYPSQKNFFDVRGYNSKNTPSQLKARLLGNSLAFHRKKGRLSQFMDKNGWMSSVVPIMGYERSTQSRYLANIERYKTINSTKSVNNYSNSASKKLKVNQQYHNIISSLMSQKLKIRKERQKLSQRQVNNQLGSITESQLRNIDIDNVEEKMLRSTKVFFNQTSSTFRNSSMKKLKDASVEKRSNSAFNSKERIHQQNFMSTDKLFMKRLIHEDIMSPQQMKLQEWQAKKCLKNTLFNAKNIDIEEQTDWKQYKINNNL